MQRLAIIGRSGGGKSTLARMLGERLGLEVVHLDALFWRPGWVESELPDFRAKVADAVSGDCWITDGNYSRVMDLYLGCAERIVWVDQPRSVCLRRVLWRVASSWRRVRPDMAAGCPERIDLEFLAYIWNWDRRTRGKVEAAIAALAPNTPVVRLRSDAEIAGWVAALPPSPRT